MPRVVRSRRLPVRADASDLTDPHKAGTGSRGIRKSGFRLTRGMSSRYRALVGPKRAIRRPQPPGEYGRRIVLISPVLSRRISRSDQRRIWTNPTKQANMRRPVLRQGSSDGCHAHATCATSVWHYYRNSGMQGARAPCFRLRLPPCHEKISPPKAWLDTFTSRPSKWVAWPIGESSPGAKSPASGGFLARRSTIGWSSGSG